MFYFEKNIYSLLSIAYFVWIGVRARNLLFSLWKIKLFARLYKHLFRRSFLCCLLLCELQPTISVGCGFGFFFAYLRTSAFLVWWLIALDSNSIQIKTAMELLYLFTCWPSFCFGCLPRSASLAA